MVEVCLGVPSKLLLVCGKIVRGLLPPPPRIGTLRCTILRFVVSSLCVVDGSKRGMWHTQEVQRVLVVLSCV